MEATRIVNRVCVERSADARLKSVQKRSYSQDYSQFIFVLGYQTFAIKMTCAVRSVLFDLLTRKKVAEFKPCILAAKFKGRRMERYHDMRNDLAVAIASTRRSTAKRRGHPMTDATDALLAGQSQGIDDEFLQKDRREHAVRERAYEIWENEGRPHGRDLEHWLSAEQQVSGKNPEA